MTTREGQRPGLAVVEFESLEAQKENIEPIRQGRSAVALAKAFSVDPVQAASTNEAVRQGYEHELVDSGDLDDPLEVWLRYIGWAKSAYPSGHNAQSGYIQLLERCSAQFVRSTHYANDPRYLKVWIEYARYSDDPRELFCFLARNDIGQDLATFYEEYAAFLEVRSRKGQADEVYQMGLVREARPTNRLRRKYDEFTQRLISSPPSTNEPTSPPIAPVRAALTTRFGGLTDAQLSTLPKSSKPKMQIFEDHDEAQESTNARGSEWTSIGTLRGRKKENTMEVRPMFGEKLPQVSGDRPVEKLEVFKDEPTIVVKPIEPVVKKNERVMCNLEAIYPEEGQEFSFEELKAKSLGLLDFMWPSLNAMVDSPPKDVYVSVMDSESPVKDSPKRRLKRQAASPTINTRAAMDDILDIFSQPLKCEQSDASSDSDSDDEQPDNTFPVIPGSWEQSEVHSAPDPDTHFNYVPADEDKDEDDDDDDEVDDIEYNEPPLPTRSHVPHENQVVTENKTHVPATPQQQALTRAGGVNMMTPITEDTENILSAARAKPLTITEEDEFGTDEPYSSPFVENPPPRSISSVIPPKRPALAERMKSSPVAAKFAAPPTAPTRGPLIHEPICNPMDPSLRQTIFSLMFPQLVTYENCFISETMSYGKKFDAIERYIRALNKKGGEATQHLEVILDFSSRFTIKKKLGEGAFAPVFLLENISGVKGLYRRKLEAVKIEKPGSAWEFHIMRSIHRRLGVNRASESIARAHEYHQFTDCSFLVIDYQDRGTLLDLINTTHTENGGVDELLAIFLAVELVRTVEALHAKNLMHGDLKADNCLLRLDSVPDADWSSQFERHGAHGWSSKGITLIDFGRGIDMNTFTPTVQFIADWQTDAQDCFEMREARPWTWQIDYHGMACIIHSLLYGRYIETVTTASLPRRHSLKSPLKRYWKQDLWEPLFDVLLNPIASTHTTAAGSAESGGAVGRPRTLELGECRARMEVWLEEHATQGVGLKGLLRKLEVEFTGARKRS